jgi:hypothetical protein
VSIDWEIVRALVVPFLVALVTIGVTRWWERRPRLISFLAHATGVRITPADASVQPYNINLHTVVLRNDGSRAATNVRLGHQPLQFTHHIQPAYAYSQNTLPDGGMEIVFPTFPPKRSVTITYLYSGVTWHQINTHLESDEGPVKVHNVLPMRQYSKAFNRTVLFFLCVGVMALAYVVWVAARYAWSAWFV